ncbi:MAG: RDD family protein [Burkholderiales bacterium]
MEAVGVGRRAVAILIDMVLLFVAGYVIALATGATTPAGFNLQGGPAFLWFGVALAYYVVMEATSGATLGKRAMGLKVVKEGGEPLDWQASLVRNILRIVDGLFFYLVGAIAVWVSKKRQRLGDMAAHTLVVKTGS